MKNKSIMAQTLNELLKYKTGDKCFLTTSDDIVEVEVVGWKISSYEKGVLCIEYFLEDNLGNTHFSFGDDLFETKEEAFQDLVENLKVKYGIE